MAEHNGPTMEADLHRTEISNQSLPAKVSSDLPAISPQASIQPRPPPVFRTDSRQNIQFRQPFPTSGPQSILTSPNPNQNPQTFSGIRSQSPGARPPATARFAPRGPPLGNPGPRPPGSTPGFSQQQRPIFRPQSPFPRAPLLAQRPQIFQQNSVPAFSRPKPLLEESLNRAQTLDSAEVEKYVVENRRPSMDQRPTSAASIGKNIAPNVSLEMANSQESLDVSRQSSVESVHRKENESVSPQPDFDSRPESRMNSIKDTKEKNRGEINGDASPHIETHTTPPINEETIEPQKKELELNLSQSKKGDNDSGVDESTQGNSCNGDNRSPRKTNKSRASSTTPTKGRSLSRGSKTPNSIQSPDSAATTPGSAEKKKLPMNKIQVGTAPSPNIKVVKSKIGSLDNASYKPGGGRVKIENKKLDYKNAGSRVEAKNDKYVPKGGEKKETQSARSAPSSSSPRKILSQKLEWTAKSKIGSLDNANHKPKGGDKKIETVKLHFKEKAAAKVGSKDNMKHQPGGGDVKKRTCPRQLSYRSGSIENKKLDIQASSKIGSMDNVKHKPAGGEKKIFDDKDYLRQQNRSGKSSIGHSLSGSQHSINSQDPKAPVADENLNQEH
ncbi:microtubule-associated protein 4 isoform X1 [Euwallacea fornicatus]|uniref:microtubule-associated protein 4 isoform X1 n=1 Tax=Euwallacea fornicatus TaxID=995702 RepID=UPI0033903EB7